jgi:sulfide dehydrogenase cytochrome subunit
MRILAVTVTGLAGLLLVPQGQAEELTRGAMLSASCAGCHGTDGHSPGSIPDISGKSAEFIRKSLEEFRSGERESTVMGRQAKGYTDEEILQIAEYFEKQG